MLLSYEFLSVGISVSSLILRDERFKTPYHQSRKKSAFITGFAEIFYFLLLTNIRAIHVRWTFIAPVGQNS